MRFTFTEEQREIRDAVAEALKDSCPATRVRAAWDARDAELRALLAELGVLGVNLPEDAGGLGLSCCDWVLPLEEAGRFAAPVALIETVATNPTLVELGRGDLAEAVASGEAFVTVMQAGGYAVDADVADLIVELGPDGVSVIDTPDLSAQASNDGSRRLFAVAGARTHTDADAAGLSDRLSLAAAAQLLGLSHAMLDLAVDYAKARRQFGKAIGSFQAVQHHLVDAMLAIRFAAPAVYRAAWSLDHGTEDARARVASAKLVASEAAVLTTKKALQVHGAIGYTFEHDLHLWMKRAWALSAAWGAPGDQLDALARHLDLPGAA